MFANDFSAKQNSKSSLDKLRTASFFYGQAKLVSAWQFCLSVPGALGISLLIAACPNTKPWGVLYSVLVALLDTLWLDRWQNRLRTLGAKSQEEFDTELFDLPWRSLQAGPRLQPEDVASANRNYRDGDSHLMDWYPASVGSLDFPFNALACQRINVWWDSVVRRKLARSILVLLFVVTIAIVAIGVATRQPADRLILTVVAPLLPVVLWCVREALRQFDAATKLDAIKTAIASTWDAALSGQVELARVKVIEFQAAIYDGRSRHPLVFNWIHRHFRPEGQETMAEMADRLAAQVE